MALSPKGKKLVDKLRFGWNKWSGPYKQLIVNDDDEWSCQACGTRHSTIVPCFMLEVFEEEFVKICSKCHRLHNDEQIDFFILIRRVRKH